MSAFKIWHMNLGYLSRCRYNECGIPFVKQSPFTCLRKRQLSLNRVVVTKGTLLKRFIHQFTLIDLISRECGIVTPGVGNDLTFAIKLFRCYSEKKILVFFFKQALNVKCRHTFICIRFETRANDSTLMPFALFSDKRNVILLKCRSRK